MQATTAPAAMSDYGPTIYGTSRRRRRLQVRRVVDVDARLRERERVLHGDGEEARRRRWKAGPHERGAPHGGLGDGRGLLQRLRDNRAQLGADDHGAGQRRVQGGTDPVQPERQLGRSVPLQRVLLGRSRRLAPRTRGVLDQRSVESSRLLRAVLAACVECFVPVAAAALASVAAGCGGDSASPSDDAGPPCMVVVPPTSCPTPPPSYSGEISSVVANYCAGASATRREAPSRCTTSRRTRASSTTG